MKKLLYSLVVFSVLFVIGCQENSITDPVPTESINKHQTTVDPFTSEVFPLEGILVHHGRFSSYYSIEGSIEYTYELVLFDPKPPSPQYNVHLNLFVEAVLSDPDLPGRNTWNISSESEDFFYVSEDGIYILEKSFPVLDRNDGLVLVCRFLVTTDGLGLNAKWLSSSSDLSVKSVSIY